MHTACRSKATPAGASMASDAGPTIRPANPTGRRERADRRGLGTGTVRWPIHWPAMHRAGSEEHPQPSGVESPAWAGSTGPDHEPCAGRADRPPPTDPAARAASASTTTTDTEPDHRPDAKPAAADDAAALVDLWVGLDHAAILDRLGRAARRGGLPEFRPGGPKGALFMASALGHPFDRDLVAWALPESDGHRLRFGLRWRRKGPALYLLAMLLTVEPGRYFLETMVPGSWGWGSIMWWYYPLTILPIPFAWASFVRRSRRSTLQTARTSHAAIRDILDAKPAGLPTGRSAGA